MTVSDAKLITIYPQAWSRQVTALAGSVSLNVAGYETTIEITKDQLVRVYFPLLAMLDELHQTSKCRVIAALAGIPGSGKSTLAAALTHIAHAVLQPKRLLVVGMDGWHLPNAVLDRRTITDHAGNQIPLRQRKGCPQSFDADALAEAVKQLHQPEHIVRLPIYDRQRHHPIPEALIVEPETPIVLIEGNYLLCSSLPWDKTSLQLSPKLFLECDNETARQRVIARHIRGGSTPQQAEHKYQTNDRINAEFILISSSPSDISIRLEPPELMQRQG